MEQVSVCIANYKQDAFLKEAIASVEAQDYGNIQIIVFNDREGVGSGEAFNRAIEQASGSIIVLLCADDIFIDNKIISDIVCAFERHPDCVHISRLYYQFIDGDKRPVRAWRNHDVLELANNPSGLAFRRSAIGECKLTNKMFIEAPSFVKSVLVRNWGNGWNEHYLIIPWDTVAVRIHASTARSQGYYKKMWTSSPVEEWTKLGTTAILSDFTSLIQIKNYYSTQAAIKEAWNFIRLRPVNILNPAFWFFALVALTPRLILMHVPHWYRITFGRWTTRAICRPS